MINAMTCTIEIHCPDCDSSDVIKSGKAATGTQRYLCKNDDCPGKTFMLDYRYKAYEPGVMEQAIEMAINGSGIRDTARVLKINRNTVMSHIKKIPRDRSGQPRLFNCCGKNRQAIGSTSWIGLWGGRAWWTMVICKDKIQPAMVVAGHWSRHRKSARICVWQTKRQGFQTAESLVDALQHQ